jgi:hypothetical protein
MNITGPGVGGGGLAVGGAFDQPEVTWPQPGIITEHITAHHSAITLMDTGIRVMCQQNTAAIGVLIRDTQVLQRFMGQHIGTGRGIPMRLVSGGAADLDGGMGLFRVVGDSGSHGTGHHWASGTLD